LTDSKKLDSILETLVHFKDTRGQNIIIIRSHLLEKSINIDISDLKRLLVFLESEKSIEFQLGTSMLHNPPILNIEYYSIRFEGERILKNGGYKRKIKIDKLKEFLKHYLSLITFLVGLIIAYSTQRNALQIEKRENIKVNNQLIQARDSLYNLKTSPFHRN
jgi:transcription initiation factor IIE alpha subunit